MKRSSKPAGGAKKKSSTRPKPRPRRLRSSGRGKVVVVVAVVALLAFVGYRFVLGTGSSRESSHSGVKSYEAETGPLSLDRIVGRWTRSDTPARFEIRGVAPNGVLDASYSNPNSIHIETAAAKQERTYLRVYLKLQDPSEPGSTYRLNYDPNLDIMRGDYYDAVARQMNDVVFTRVK